MGPSLPSLPEVVVHSAESSTITTSSVKMSSSSSIVIQNVTTKAQINGEASGKLFFANETHNHLVALTYLDC